MSTLTLPEPLTPTGEVLTDDAQDELLQTELPLSFSHIKRDQDGAPILDENEQPITLARHAMIVDPNRIESHHLLAFQARSSEIQAEAERCQDELESLNPENGGNRASRRAAQRAAKGTDADERAVITRLTVASFNLAVSLKTAKAGLLALAVCQWTLRKGGKMIEPTPQFLLQRTGPGADAFEALEAWYFPTSNGAEEETGTPESPSSPAP